MGKDYYIDRLEKIFFKYGLEGSLLEKNYTDGIRNNDLTCCYIDGRIKNSSKLRKELKSVLEQFLTDFPKAKRPFYTM